MPANDTLALHDVIVAHLEAGQPGAHLDHVAAANDHDSLVRTIIDNLHSLLNDVVVTDNDWSSLGNDASKRMDDCS